MIRLRKYISPNVVMSFFMGVGVAFIVSYIAGLLRSNFLMNVLLFPGLPAAEAEIRLSQFFCGRGLWTGTICQDDLMWATLAISSWLFYGLVFALVAWVIERRMIRARKVDG